MLALSVFALAMDVTSTALAHPATFILARIEVPWEVVPLVLLGGGVVWLVRQRGGSRIAGTQEGIEVKPKRSTIVGQEALTGPPAAHHAAAQDVNVSVFAPPKAPPSEEILIQAIFHTPERKSEAASHATITDRVAQQVGSTPLTLQIHLNDTIKATLECSKAKIVEPVKTANWNGRLVCLYFLMQLPEAAVETRLKAFLHVFVNGMPAGDVAITLAVMPNAQDEPPKFANEDAHAYQRPFLSYASEDRTRVLHAAQLLNALKLKYFQDILSLSPGERWKQRLYMEIDRCDVFVLFWSQYARASEWVNKETEYALKREPPIKIVPILLEGPPPPPPPPSLQDIQFNDPVRHVIFAEENAEARKKTDGELDALGKSVDMLFETPAGRVASLRDGTAISCIGTDWRFFESLAVYRQVHKDNDPWKELNQIEDRRQFCRELRDEMRRRRPVAV